MRMIILLVLLFGLCNPLAWRDRGEYNRRVVGRSYPAVEAWGMDDTGRR